VINFHCIIISVVVLDSVITHTSTWFSDMEIHQLVKRIVLYSERKRFGLLQGMQADSKGCPKQILMYV